jgi:hypothetical protein
MFLKRIRHLCAVILIVTAVGCAPQVRKSDDGHHAWARQVVVTLLGRQPAGEAEVRVIADLAALRGRESAAEALMASPEFAAHWSDLLIDLVRAPREGDKSLSSCVGTPLRSGPVTPALAEWVNTNAPTSSGAPGGAFNLADLLVSSIAADNLSPFLRAYVFAFASKPLVGTEISELDKRDNLYRVFEGTLLGRNSTCLACHNSSWSFTDKEHSGWNRTFSPLGYFERSLLGAHSGPYNPKRVKALFRVEGVINEGNATPWGISGCGSFQPPSTDDPELAATEQAYLAGDRGRRASIFTVEQLFRSGIEGLADGLDRSVNAGDQQACTLCGSCPPGAVEPPTDAAQQAREDAVKNLFRTKGCFGCHGSGLGGTLHMQDNPNWKDSIVRVVSDRGSPLPRVEPGHAANSFLVKALDPLGGIGSPFPMPPIGTALTSAELAMVRAWIDGMPAGAGCATCAGNGPGLVCPAPQADVPGDQALAYLVALNLSDKIWTQVMGRPLTIAHHFSRNLAQRDLLWHLTEAQFIANAWSLKKLLSFIVTSDYYNRRPPEDGDGTTTPSGTASPYEMPMFFDPWIEQDPRVPPASNPGYVAAEHPEKHANAVSETVERKPAVTLLRSIASALGWPSPRREPDDVQYPTRNLAIAIGQFLQDAVPGFQGENLSAFVEWEATVATCRKPKEVNTDWIDRLETAIRAHNSANPSDQVTVAQAAEIVKDWLLADGRMSLEERAIVGQLFGRGQNEAATLVEPLNDRLRDYCGVLLEAPRFKLAGITTDGVGHPPKLRVCNAPPCTYQEICSDLVRQAGTTGLICEDQAIRSVAPREIVTRDSPTPTRTAARVFSNDAVITMAAVMRRAAVEPSDFRLAIRPDQLQRARVAQAKGVAVLDSKGLTILSTGLAIPNDALIISEKGAMLHLTINRATVPVNLPQQQLPEGSIDALDRQLATLPEHVRERAIKVAREGALAEMGRPEHARSRIPLGTVDAALSSAFPYGSGGEPIRREQGRTNFDYNAMQKRFDAVRRRQQ